MRIAGGFPESWMWATVRDVTLPVEQVDPRQTPEEEFTYLDISGIDNTINVVAENKKYVGADAPSRARQLVWRGDVLFSTVRTYLKNVARVPERFNGAVASTGFSILRCVEGLDPDYLFYYTLTAAFLNPLADLQRGSSYPAVRDSDVRDQPLPLPPLNEQRRIVAKIEELFSELDAGVASLKTAREQLKVYRQALLKHAFEGKLTPAWRAENADKLESADALLARIRAEREERYHRQLAEWEEAVLAWEWSGAEGRKPSRPSKPKELPPLTAEELAQLPELPDGWSWARVGNVSAVGTGATPLKRRTDYYLDGDVAWVTSGALNSLFVREPSGYVTRLALEETNLKLFPKHSLLVAMYGEGKTRGKCSELLVEATTNQAIAVIVQEGIEEQIRGYLKLLLVKNYYDLRKKSSGGVQPNLNLGLIENMPFPLCSFEEARRIQDEVDGKLSVVDRLHAQIQTELHHAEALRQSILTRAFSGRLVPQDPHDEPASVLLERIRAEKAAAGSGKPTRRVRADEALTIPDKPQRPQQKYVTSEPIR